MTKEEWITSWTSDRYSHVNKEVIEFIGNILFHSHDTESIYQLFACGYCYYFAIILKTAFNRGDIVWHKGFSHIMWRDTDNIVYDIGGVFEEGDVVPIEELGEGIIDFKHITNK